MRNTAAGIACTLLLAAAVLSAFGNESGEEAQEQLLRDVLRYSPEYTIPIRRTDDSPVVIFADLNADGVLDAAVLTIVNDPRVEATVSALANPLRLYDEELVEPVFILEAYFSGQEAVLTVELGRRELWSGFDLLRLGTDAFPLALRVGFRTRTGARTDLVVFQEGGRVSRLSFDESRNQRGFVVDVDGDGLLEVVTAHRVPEAGRGFETFLELYRLEPEGFRRTASIPLVRTANDFITAAAAEMERGDWDAVRARLHSPRETDAESVLAAAFGGIADEEIPQTAFDYPAAGDSVERVTFPRLTDNPFPAPYIGRSFRVLFRVECCHGDPRFFEAVVGLTHNPFDGSPVAFLTEPEDGL